MKIKAQRIRDPLHNLIEFRSRNQLEQALWRVIQTPPFQRLRRVRQLGFSELVYPGATHTRFSHSIGVFHTARLLMEVIEAHIRAGNGMVQEHQKQVALAAALVHDVGHGMFSHAFEDVGKRLSLKMADHEHVSDLLIRDSEISHQFAELGSGFANDVADVIGRGRPGGLYDAVVSSQFDADRLDYMQRDRLMTGVRNSGIDFVWLINNLVLAEVPFGADEEKGGKIQTFVLSPKAIHEAETYILSLFQLYPTVYFHKATRGAEKIFSQVMMQLVKLARDSSTDRTGLPANHPIIRFALEPDKIDNALALDDTVFWGALSMLKDAPDSLIGQFSARLWQRKLFKCIDVHQEIVKLVGAQRGRTPAEINEYKNRVERISVSVKESLEEWLESQTDVLPKLLIDKAERHPYKRFDESKGPLNQIAIQREDDTIFDMAEVSPAVAALEPFSLFRVYCDGGDQKTRNHVLDLIRKRDQELE